MMKLTERERNSILRSLASGGVPVAGLKHLAVAREAETRAICSDIDSVAEGGSAFRILKGEVGSGKTFMANLTREEALKKNLVVAQTEFGINHRLYGRDGRGRAFLGSVMSNLFTRTSSEPGALRRVIELWINTVAESVKQAQGTDDQIKAEIGQRLRVLNDHENGQAFAHVLGKYYEGFTSDNSTLQDAAIRWLRAEYSTKMEAREALGIRTIIRDEDVYPALKVFARFCRIAGFGGLYVILDELSAITERLSNAKAREGSFHTLLKMVNESIQGGAPGLGFVIAGTDDAVENEETGLYSYLPLRSRLKSCAGSEGVNKYGAIIQLETLGYEHLYELLRKVVRVHAGGDPDKELLPEDGIKFYLEQHLGGAGASKKVNPRDVIRPFVDLLVTLEEHPGKTWQEFFAKTESKTLLRQ